MEDWDEAKLSEVAHTKHDADDAARPNQTEIVNYYSVLAN
jgi:hypothetical protein